MDILYTFAKTNEGENFSFRIKLLKGASEFIQSLPEQVGRKVVSNVMKVARGEWNKNLFKKLEGTEIWEFRTRFRGMAYRLFSFWDKDDETLVVATHGIIKKTQKTPRKEIDKAETIRRRYFEDKNKTK